MTLLLLADYDDGYIPLRLGKQDRILIKGVGYVS
jgi:hypothetical protein